MLLGGGEPVLESFEKAVKDLKSLLFGTDSRGFRTVAPVDKERGGGGGGGIAKSKLSLKRNKRKKKRNEPNKKKKREKDFLFTFSEFRIFSVSPCLVEVV
jgi:hypothetical protein